jgi:hypothetical protein
LGLRQCAKYASLLPVAKYLWERKRMEAVEMSPIPDIYADGIADVELLGDNIRLTFFTWRGGEKIIVCRLVRPKSSYLNTDEIAVKIQRLHREALQELQ